MQPGMRTLIDLLENADTRTADRTFIPNAHGIKWFKETTIGPQIVWNGNYIVYDERYKFKLIAAMHKDQPGKWVFKMMTATVEQIPLILYNDAAAVAMNGLLTLCESIKPTEITLTGHKQIVTSFATVLGKNLGVLSKLGYAYSNGKVMRSVASYD